MSSVHEIEEAIRRLPELDLAALRAWFAEFDAGAWDHQFERDVADGRLEALGDEALADWREGRCLTLTAQALCIEKLAKIQRLSPNVRFGQLLANLGFLVEDRTDRSLRDVEDGQLLEIMEEHRGALARRQSTC